MKHRHCLSDQVVGQVTHICTCSGNHSHPVYTFNLQQIVVLSTKEQMFDHFKTSLEVSHLCGHHWCNDPDHLCLEGRSVNSSRERCHSKDTGDSTQPAYQPQTLCSAHPGLPCLKIPRPVPGITSLIEEYFVARGISLDVLATDSDHHQQYLGQPTSGDLVITNITYLCFLE